MQLTEGNNLSNYPSCGHEKGFGVPLCFHLRACRVPWIKYVKWFTGVGLDTELICISCAEDRRKGKTIECTHVCEQCFTYATEEVGQRAGIGGRPEIRVASDDISSTLTTSEIPSKCKRVLDISPINAEKQSVWLLLAEGGKLWRFHAESGEVEHVGSLAVFSESQQEDFLGHSLTTRLHTSPTGRFVAVVNDYGQYGSIFDIHASKVTLKLDGGTYHPETVPFSFAFAEWKGRAVAIHRTDWNRLDVSDAETGQLLTSRGPTSYRKGEQRPQHYLDYFHGALYLSPNGSRILDDGWVWHPVGIPVVWDLQRWLAGNIWESEDGPSKRDLCGRDYYWDHGLAWLSDSRIAVGGIGNDSNEIIDGARIFDISRTENASPRWRSDWVCAREESAFAGPSGRFFSGGNLLYSSGNNTLSIWDPATGIRTGQIEGFNPGHQHLGAAELAQLCETKLVRWNFPQ